jgi:lauroyl/myristoyl acyltransferase
MDINVSELPNTKLAGRSEGTGLHGSFDERGTRQWIHSLSDDDVAGLFPQTYSNIFSNLLLIFHRVRPAGDIRKMAARCTRHAIWERHAIERRISSVIEAARLNVPAILLKGWDPLLLHSLLKRKRGLIICSIHMGASQFLPLEIALQGLSVITAGFPRFCASLDSEHDISQFVPSPEPYDSCFTLDVFGWKLLRNGDTGIHTQLLGALRRNEVVLLSIDDPGSLETSPGSGVPIEFFGLQTRVEDSIARLAWTSSAPVLPLCAVMDGSEPGRILYGTPWLPPETRTTSSEQGFRFDLTSGLYAFLAGHVRSYPDQWLGVEKLHTWWLPRPSSIA